MNPFVVAGIAVGAVVVGGVVGAAVILYMARPRWPGW